MFNEFDELGELEWVRGVMFKEFDELGELEWVRWVLFWPLAKNRAWIGNRWIRQSGDLCKSGYREIPWIGRRLNRGLSMNRARPRRHIQFSQTIESGNSGPKLWTWQSGIRDHGSQTAQDQVDKQPRNLCRNWATLAHHCWMIPPASLKMCWAPPALSIKKESGWVGRTALRRFDKHSCRSAALAHRGQASENQQWSQVLLNYVCRQYESGNRDPACHAHTHTHTHTHTRVHHIRTSPRLPDTDSKPSGKGIEAVHWSFEPVNRWIGESGIQILSKTSAFQRIWWVREVGLS